MVVSEFFLSTNMGDNASDDVGFRKDVRDIWKALNRSHASEIHKGLDLQIQVYFLTTFTKDTDKDEISDGSRASISDDS